jgi:F-type H+-transporting ATPase subunit delta
MAHQNGQHASPAALAYAQSLLELATEQGQAEPIGQEMEQLRGIIDQNPSLREVLASPAVGVEERSQLLDKVFRNNVSPLVFGTLGVMNQHGRLGLLDQMAGAYGDLLDEQLGKVEVDLTVAQPLSTEQLETARQRVSEVLKRDAVVHQHVDENIIGGVIVRAGDKLIDASVRYQLTAMKDQLLAAAPR